MQAGRAGGEPGASVGGDKWALGGALKCIHQSGALAARRFAPDPLKWWAPRLLAPGAR